MSSDVKVLQLNIRSLRQKLTDISSLQVETQCNVIALCETWLDQTIPTQEVDIPGFQLHRLDRLGSRGGGVCLYVKDGFVSRPRPDLTVPNVECCWIEISTKTKPCLVGSYYRPPGLPVAHWQLFESMLSSAIREAKDIIFCGDFNTDINRADYQRTHLTDIMDSLGLIQHVTGPTRMDISGSTSTLDLMYSSLPADTPTSASPVSFSDHYALVSTFCITASTSPIGAHAVWSRNFRKIDMAQFRSDLIDSNLCNIHEIGSCEDMWNEWLSRIGRLIDRHAPLKPRHVRAKQIAPWFTSDLWYIIKRRNRAHRKWIATKSRDDYAYYSDIRRAATRLNRQLKQEYYQDQLTRVRGKPGQTWKVINHITGRTRSSPAPQCSAAELGNVFANIVHDPHRPTCLVPPVGPELVCGIRQFSPVSIASVRKLLQNLNSQKATGSDGIPASLLKSCCDLLAPSLSLVFNRSLSEGYVPSAMKHANITPLFKGGDSKTPTNYRPVSLLSIVSKILERVVHNQLSAYLQNFNLYPRNQFGFRKQHSTEDALVHVTEEFRRSKDVGNSSGAVLVDLSKAFDKVQHQTLICDLFNLGISGPVLNWFISYLSGRKQRVKFGNCHSNQFCCTSGVPQGSVLGPLLFVLYVRDVASEIDVYNVHTAQFADDILLYKSRKDVPTLQSNLSSAVTHLSKWLASRNLVLNDRKTQVLFIPATTTMPRTLSVHCSGVLLQQVDSAKYLGAYIDSDLKCNNMVDYIIKKAAPKIAVLFRNRHCLSLQCRIVFLHSVILPDFFYASNMFAATISSSQLQRLERLLKRAVRAVFDLPYIFPTAFFFDQLGLTSVESSFCRKLVIFTWRCLNHECSISLYDLFEPLRTGRSHDSRMLKYPLCKTTAGTNSVSFKCVSLWNNLPAHVRSLTAYRAFNAAIPSPLLFP